MHFSLHLLVPFFWAAQSFAMTWRTEQIDLTFSTSTYTVRGAVATSSAPVGPATFHLFWYQGCGAGIYWPATIPITTTPPATKTDNPNELQTCTSTGTATVLPDPNALGFHDSVIDSSFGSIFIPDNDDYDISCFISTNPGTCGRKGMLVPVPGSGGCFNVGNGYHLNGQTGMECYYESKLHK